MDVDDKLHPMDIDDEVSEIVEEDDEVIREVPVFMSQQLAKYLYLFQYPVRTIPFTPATGPIAARIKPVSQLIELDLPLDTRSSMYSEERGKDFARGTNDRPIRTALDNDDSNLGRSGGSRREEAAEEMLDRQTLGSSIVPNQTNYMVGVIKDSELFAFLPLCKSGLWSCVHSSSSS